MSDNEMTNHAVGAGVSFLFGGPIGLAIYAGYSAYRYNKNGGSFSEKDENGNVKPTDWINAGFKSGDIAKPLDK